MSNPIIHYTFLHTVGLKKTINICLTPFPHEMQGSLNCGEHLRSVELPRKMEEITGV